MKKDRLFLLVRKHVDSTSERSQSFEEVIVEAVGDHLAELMDDAFIPHMQLDAVEEVLMEEAWDMLRKLTYGSLTLQDYRDSLSKRERRKKATC